MLRSDPPEESLQQLFINQIDTFTVWHIRLLDLFKDPLAWFKRERPELAGAPSVGILEHIITDAWPELTDRKGFLNVVVQELGTKGLLKSSGLRTSLSSRSVPRKEPQEWGFVSGIYHGSIDFLFLFYIRDSIGISHLWCEEGDRTDV